MANLRVVRSPALDEVTVKAVSESFPAFCSTLGLALYPWQQDAFGEALTRQGGRFTYRLAGISVPRGNGKSFAAAAAGFWRFRFGPPPQLILSVGLLLDGAKVVLKHARALMRAFPLLGEGVKEVSGGFEIPKSGSAWIIRSSDHTSSRGEHPDVVLYDELGWVQDDELFASLQSSQASVDDPLMLCVSTVGRKQGGPLWSIKQAAEGGEEETFWYHSSENGSPRVTPAFLERQRRVLLPGQFAREHQNQWIDAADSFTTSSDVDAAMSRDWVEETEGRERITYQAFVDLGAVHDPTVIAVGHREAGEVYLDRLLAFQGSRERPVDLASVEAAILDLRARFRLTKIRIESWQGLSAVQSLGKLGVPVELFTPTAKTNADEWPVLQQRLASRTLHLFPHMRLREELLNLVVEQGPTGLRVLDKGKIHQDHAVALRGVCAMVGGRAEQTIAPPISIGLGSNWYADVGQVAGGDCRSHIGGPSDALDRWGGLA